MIVHRRALHFRTRISHDAEFEKSLFSEDSNEVLCVVAGKDRSELFKVLLQSGGIDHRKLPSNHPAVENFLKQIQIDTDFPVLSHAAFIRPFQYLDDEDREQIEGTNTWEKFDENLLNFK